ncbi:MAG: arginine deiminase-related protein [Acidobacteriota bacterium]|nr:arginine deiminase-related protein [Acidobacteriota bacterium]
MAGSRFLMCPPVHFGVEYVINPWMEGQMDATNSAVAHQQWAELNALLTKYSEVASLPAVKGLPDLVFTANAALIHRDTAILSSFRFPERQPESEHFAAWLRADGFNVQTLPPGVLFEGAGDALFDRAQPLLWFGHGFRSDLSAKEHLEEFVEAEVQPLRLRDGRFYHLDTCFCPLEGGYLLYYSDAFSEDSKAAIEARVPPNRRMALTEEDALHFACNTVNIGNAVILNHASSELATWLEDRGFQVSRTPLTEFMRAGGAAKCLSLRLDESCRWL